MSKCEILKNREADWAWQPFGPGETALTFTAEGCHYRGFPVLKISDEAKRRIEAGETLTFVYRKRLYAVRDCETYEIEFKA